MSMDEEEYLTAISKNSVARAQPRVCSAVLGSRQTPRERPSARGTSWPLRSLSLDLYLPSAAHNRQYGS